MDCEGVSCFPDQLSSAVVACRLQVQLVAVPRHGVDHPWCSHPHVPSDVFVQFCGTDFSRRRVFEPRHECKDRQEPSTILFFKHVDAAIAFGRSQLADVFDLLSYVRHNDNVVKKPELKVGSKRFLFDISNSVSFLALLRQHFVRSHETALSLDDIGRDMRFKLFALASREGFSPGDDRFSDFLFVVLAGSFNDADFVVCSFCRFPFICPWTGDQKERCNLCVAQKAFDRHR